MFSCGRETANMTRCQGVVWSFHITRVPAALKKAAELMGAACHIVVLQQTET